jgi:hypothetical protein
MFLNGIQMNLLKLRYSWGKVGSDADIDRWLYTSEYTNGGGTNFGYPLQSYLGILERNIPILDATWEEALKQNIGIEMGFFTTRFR